MHGRHVQLRFQNVCNCKCLSSWSRLWYVAIIIMATACFAKQKISNFASGFTNKIYPLSYFVHQSSLLICWLSGSGQASNCWVGFKARLSWPPKQTLCISWSMWHVYYFIATIWKTMQAPVEPHTAQTSHLDFKQHQPYPFLSFDCFLQGRVPKICSILRLKFGIPISETRDHLSEMCQKLSWNQRSSWVV